MRVTGEASVSPPHPCCMWEKPDQEDKHLPIIEEQGTNNAINFHDVNTERLVYSSHVAWMGRANNRLVDFAREQQFSAVKDIFGWPSRLEARSRPEHHVDKLAILSRWSRSAHDAYYYSNLCESRTRHNSMLSWVHVIAQMTYNWAIALRCLFNWHS